MDFPIKKRPNVSVIGSGVSGLTVADYLSDFGFDVNLISSSDGPDSTCCSWWAGGMLALNCELETAEPIIGVLGKESMEYWKGNAPDFQMKGTLVLATRRDQPLLHDFKRNTEQWEEVSGSSIHELEPDIHNSFQSALLFKDEAHITPRLALSQLEKKLRQKQVKFQFKTKLSGVQIEEMSRSSWVVDCRGMGAKSSCKNLRGVKGEMLYVQSDEINISRPIRLLHPRIPIYIVPRGKGIYMLGASMIENEKKQHATVRSVMELLSAAYAVNPAFAEAQILEIGVDLRPALPDNVPAINIEGKRISVNGMYRHGYLAAPAMARQVKDLLLNIMSSKELAS